MKGMKSIPKAWKKEKRVSGNLSLWKRYLYLLVSRYVKRKYQHSFTFFLVMFPALSTPLFWLGFQVFPYSCCQYFKSVSLAIMEQRKNQKGNKVNVDALRPTPNHVIIRVVGYMLLLWYPWEDIIPELLLQQSNA